jgi:hypothetical protein
MIMRKIDSSSSRPQDDTPRKFPHRYSKYSSRGAPPSRSINAVAEISLSRMPSLAQRFGGLDTILLDIRRRGDVARRACNPYQKGKES